MNGAPDTFERGVSCVFRIPGGVVPMVPMLQSPLARPALGLGPLGTLGDIFEGARKGLEATCLVLGGRVTDQISGTAWLDAQTAYRLLGRASYDEVVRQLSRWLAGRYGDRQQVCQRFYLSSGQSLATFSRQFINEAAAIGMGLLRVPNEQRPELHFSYAFLSLIRDDIGRQRTYCLSYLASIGLDSYAADTLCTAMGGFANSPPTTGFSFTIPNNFRFSTRFVQKARESLDYLLIQEPPSSRPAVTRLPSLQIAPPMR